MFTSGGGRGESLRKWHGEPLYHADLAPEEYRDLLTRSGFDLAANVIEDASCGGATVWLARRL